MVFLVSGCTSFGRGVAEAFLDKEEERDERICQVWGKSFKGLDPWLNNTNGQAKVLMVHGVGNHLPGYSTQLLEKLGVELGLNVVTRHYKDIALTDPLDSTKKLGRLRVNRLLNQGRSRELLFYELTWSEITAPEKALLNYDNSGEYEFRRATLNNILKKFANDTGPDPMIYLGESREDILISFAQSMCWMMVADWDGLPESGQHACTITDKSAAENVEVDHFALISHSLGSRITIDGLQRIANLLGNNLDTVRGAYLKPLRLIEALKGKRIPIYMLSNQLPILQMGRKLPEIVGQHDMYCQAEGKHYDSRIFAETSIIAFSDPNDILSYAIPGQFAEKTLDSRLCVEITNININVALVINAFGLGEMANPLAAHTGYDGDDRVISLIAKGIGHPQTAPLIKERCQWHELID